MEDDLTLPRAGSQALGGLGPALCGDGEAGEAGSTPASPPPLSRSRSPCRLPPVPLFFPALVPSSPGHLVTTLPSDLSFVDPLASGLSSRAE